ncbi:MAG: hypothetical protein R2942_14420 [Ignavibacteria bacterium]
MTPSTTAPITYYLSMAQAIRIIVLYFDEIKNFNSTGGDTVKDR